MQLPKTFRGTEDYSPQMRRWLRQNGEKEIVAIRVRRKELAAATKLLMNVLTLGKFDKKTKAMGLDAFFHLSMVLELSDGKRWIVEKLNQISAKPFDGQWHDSMIVPIKGRIKVFDFFDRARKSVGDNAYFWYDPVDSNCQRWVKICLEANGLWKPHIAEFVMQDAEELFRRLPSWSHWLGRKITDAGAIAERVLYGANLPEGEIPKHIRDKIVRKAQLRGEYTDKQLRLKIQNWLKVGAPTHEVRKELEKLGYVPKGVMGLLALNEAAALSDESDSDSDGLEAARNAMFTSHLPAHSKVSDYLRTGRGLFHRGVAEQIVHGAGLNLKALGSVVATLDKMGHNRFGQKDEVGLATTLAKLR